MLGLTGPVRMSTTEIDDRRCDDFTEGRPCTCAGSELVALMMGGFCARAVREVHAVREVRRQRAQACACANFCFVVSKGTPPRRQWVRVASEKIMLPYTRVHPWPSNSWLT